MWPFLIRNPLIGTQNVIVVLAAFLSYLISRHNASSLGIPKEEISNIYFISVLFGLVGAKIPFSHNLPKFPLIYWFQYSGFSSFTALAFSLTAFVLYTRLKQLSTFQLADVMFPGLAVFLALSRMGCFFGGCCYGIIFPVSFFSVRFPKISPAYLYHLKQGFISPSSNLSLPVFPVQI